MIFHQINTQPLRCSLNIISTICYTQCSISSSKINVLFLIISYEYPLRSYEIQPHTRKSSIGQQTSFFSLTVNITRSEMNSSSGTPLGSTAFGDREKAAEGQWARAQDAEKLKAIREKMQKDAEAAKSKDKQ
ncbi:hypothetical protein F4703DRAFT_1940007 [Phycomyces blakesleeanus]